MSRLLRALEKAGLVEVEERAANTGATPSPQQAPLPVAAALALEPTAPVAVADGPITENRPFEEIYTQAQVQAAPFPAEKLLRILDGLAALDPAARKAAVLALDAADEAWTIDEALLDAERKARALDEARKQLEDQARAILQQTKAEIEQRAQQQQETEARVRRQIADLEGLLQREIARASEEKSALDAHAHAAKEACARESARYEAEKARLAKLAEIFSAPPTASTSH